MMVIIRAVRKVYAHKVHYLVSAVFSLFMFTLLILVPVGRLDLSAFYYQVTGLDALSLVAFGFFAALAGVLISMEVFILRKLRENKLKTSGRGLLAVAASFVAGIFGSGVCAFCVAVILSLIGAPLSILTFLLDHRWEVLGVSSLILLTSLYFVSKAVMTSPHECKVCRIPGR